MQWLTIHEWWYLKDSPLSLVAGGWQCSRGPGQVDRAGSQCCMVASGDPKSWSCRTSASHNFWKGGEVLNSSGESWWFTVIKV